MSVPSLRIEHELPDFLEKQVVFCESWMERRNQKSCLLLTRNIKFYEFRRKQMINMLDLKSTCLEKIKTKLEQYEGPKSQWYANADESGNMVSIALQIEQRPIIFGKFIYIFLEIRRFYVLLQCWDKLIVLERLSNMEGYKITIEYENVKAFKLVESKMKYQAIVEISFHDGTTLTTDFQTESEERNSDTNVQNEASEKAQRNEFRHMLERLRTAQLELHIHKAMTQKEFDHLRNIRCFGETYRRSLNLEEKQILSRCGDIWSRITPHDWLVIGVPLVNNCSLPNKTTPANLRVIFGVNEEETTGLSYQYRLYQLGKQFNSLNILNNFFQCSEFDGTSQADVWEPVRGQSLMPDSFAVLLIKVKISQLVTLEKCPLILLFDVEIETDNKSKKEVFEHQLFLKNFDFAEVLNKQSSLEISFHPTTLHQDLLSTIYTAVELRTVIHFITLEDLNAFRNMFVTKCDFNIHSGQAMNNSNSEETMETDRQQDEEKKCLSQNLFYNHTRGSIWFGFVVLEMPNSDNDFAGNDLKVLWKFYSPNEDKLILLLKFIFNEMISCGCNVSHIECPPEYEANTKVKEFENALRQELAALMQLLNNSSLPKSVDAICEELLKLELQTDLLAAEHKL